MLNITGSQYIVGILTIEHTNSFLKAVKSFSIRPNQSLQVDNDFLSCPAFNNAVRAGLLICHEDLDRSNSQEELFLDKSSGAESAIPAIDRIDSVNGIVYFKPYDMATYQIEVFKYTKYRSGSHIRGRDNKVYTPRIGKRFKPFLTLGKNATLWAVPSWLLGLQEKRKKFKFGFVKLNRFGVEERTGLSICTIQTAIASERVSAPNKTRSLIILEEHH